MAYKWIQAAYLAIVHIGRGVWNAFLLLAVYALRGCTGCRFWTYDIENKKCWALFDCTNKTAKGFISGDEILINGHCQYT